MARRTYTIKFERSLKGDVEIEGIRGNITEEGEPKYLELRDVYVDDFKRIVSAHILSGNFRNGCSITEGEVTSDPRDN